MAKAKTKIRKKPMTKKRTKASAGKIAKKIVKAAKRKAMAKKVAKKVTRTLARKKSEPGMLGKVVHYYDRIGVAVLELISPVRVGQMVRFRRGPFEFMQVITSLQIDRRPVEVAKKGDAVGMKVAQPVDRGATMFSA